MAGEVLARFARSGGVKAQRTRWGWLAVALVAMSTAGSAHAVPVGKTVGRVALTQPNVELSFGGVLLSKSSLKAGSVMLRLRDVKTSKVVRCGSKHKGAIQIVEYVNVESGFVETGLSYEATPSSNVISFTVKPDLTADYLYEFGTADETPFAFTSCTVKDA